MVDCLVYRNRTLPWVSPPSYSNLHPLHRYLTRSTSVNTAANTTVSRFFSDRHSGATTESTDSSEDSPTRRQRSLLHRLHISTAIKRGKSPQPLRPPTAPAAISAEAAAVTAVRTSPAHSNDATIQEITRIMPQSLMISTPPQNSATKRQRSADSRNGRPRADSAGRNLPSAVPSASSRTPLKANIKMPAYLEKSRNGGSRHVSMYLTRTNGLYRSYGDFPGVGVEAKISTFSCYGASGDFSLQGR